MPDLRDGQPSRFATILLYLNDVPKGGETSFPRWLNGETTDILKVKPEHGKAILFYNQLPDGNYDERSQHAALPVIEGEKWLANLWVWVSLGCCRVAEVTRWRLHVLFFEAYEFSSLTKFFLFNVIVFLFCRIHTWLRLF